MDVEMRDEYHRRRWEVDGVKMLVLGGDGYLGWPTAMRFSARGHDVLCVDNLARRRFHAERGTDSLTPIAALGERVEVWRAITGRAIGYRELDVTDYDQLLELVREFSPETVVHYAEQPSAPYSMIDRDHAVATQTNNVVGTLNLLWAMREVAPEAHLVKLGTMGEYGTPNIDIEEGFLEVTHKGRSDRVPFPKQPGSFYHLSKVFDSGNIMLACKVWNLRATDLNQGVVYGVHTDETCRDPRLTTRFDYDELFGTALNRFCVQAVAGYPITVYGSGGQRRSFLNIRDTLQCVELAADNPPVPGEYRVFNQFTEVFSVGELAQTVFDAATRVGLDVMLEHLSNPRVENEEHYYNPVNDQLLRLGLQPTLLSEELVGSMLSTIELYKERIAIDAIPPTVKWR